MAQHAMRRSGEGKVQKGRGAYGWPPYLGTSCLSGCRQGIQERLEYDLLLSLACTHSTTAAWMRPVDHRCWASAGSKQAGRHAHHMCMWTAGP